MIEEWRNLNVLGFNNYEVSNFGNVRRIGTEKTLKLSLCHGYPRVTLYKNRKGFPTKVHKMVLFAFKGKRPKGYDSAHLNGIKSDNRIENLAWVTRKENMSHKIIHGTRQHGERHGCHKLTLAQVQQILKEYRPPEGRKVQSKWHHGNSGELAVKFGVSKGTIQDIVRGDSWSTAIAKAALKEK